MRYVFILLLVLGAAVACDTGDDDDGTNGQTSACDEWIAGLQDVADAVCADYPVCMYCKDVDESSIWDHDDQMPTEDECQAVVDELDTDAILDHELDWCEQNPDY